MVGQDCRQMACDVGVPFGSRSRIVNKIMFFRAMRFWPVHLESNLSSLTGIGGKAFNGESSSPRHRQSRMQFLSSKRDRGPSNYGYPIVRFVCKAL